jgi:hypothetical protein
MTVNPDILSNVVEAALAKVGGSKRWENAIYRGAQLIEEERCLPTEDGRLLIFSESGAEYSTTATECRAGDKHRAAFRLMALLEAAEEAGETSH